MNDKIQKILKFSTSIHKQKEEWVEKNIRPHLIDLLNKAQRRLNRPLSFEVGMGTLYFSLGPKANTNLELWFTEAVSQQETKHENPMVTAIRRRFPELVEFCDIICVVGDDLDICVGDLKPTIEYGRY